MKLKAEVLKSNGGQPIRLSPEEHQRLNALRKKIDPEVLKRIDLLADAEYPLPPYTVSVHRAARKTTLISEPARPAAPCATSC